MNRQEAQKILSAYRHGTDDEKDPLFAEALALARRDAELSAWLADSLAFDSAFRSELSHVEAPSQLEQMILAQSKIIRPRPWWNPRLSVRHVAQAAAIVVILGSVAALWAMQRPTSFAHFRREIAEGSWGSRQHVQAKAANLNDVREFLVANGVATNFALPSPLTQLKIRGCTLVKWRGYKVPALCFNSDGKHLHFIVVARTLFDDPPEEVPQTDQWESWHTASWSKDEHSYVLTGLNTSAFVKTFRKGKRWDWGG
jgi:hypothetical protein